MKLLESRHMSSDVTLMKWSPKMDILAIANSKPEVVLHRLSWQKVWTLGNNFGRTGMLQSPNPKSLTFHPEGLYLAIGFDDGVTLVEVETGNIVVQHEVPHLSAVKWKSTSYFHSLKDVFSTESERLESNLSILLLGTKSGEIHIYAGAGQLFTVTLKLTSAFPCQVLDIEIPLDFSSVQVLASNNCDSPGKALSLYYFDCYEYAFHGEILGVFAAKAISYKRYISSIEGEIAAVHENWGIIVEVYKHYLSYGTGRTSENIKADYAELLITGVCSPELEMFLGSGGREKEAKKFINTLQGASASFNDALKNIKSNIISLLRELADITGYFSYVQINNENCPAKSQDEEEASKGSEIITKLKSLLSLLYHGAVHAQHMAETFLTSFFNFITLLVNTIHLFNVIESPELPEEEADPELVFALLRFQVTRYIFEMLELNPENTNSATKNLIPDAMTSDSSHSLSFGRIIPPILKDVVPQMTDDELKKFYDEPNILDIDETSTCAGDETPAPSSTSEWPRLSEFLKEKGLAMKPNIFSDSNTQLQRMLMSFTQRAEQELQALLKVPVLASQVSKKNFVLNYFENNDFVNDLYGIIVDPDVTSTTFLYHKIATDSEVFRVWLYRIDNLGTSNSGAQNPVVITALLEFSQQVLSADFLNSSVFSILCYLPQIQPASHRRPAHLQEEESYEPLEIPGNSSLCHIDLHDIFQNLPSRNLRIPRSTTIITDKWTQLNICVPSDVTVPGPIEHEQIVQILPIPNYHPTVMALSGSRRIGALLDTTKRIIQLMDMDLESSENSIDLDTTSSTVTEDVRDLAIE